MKVVEAIDQYYNLAREKNIKVFLAGGITNCPDWQAEVIKYLEEKEDTDNLVIFNPRRKHFDVTDKSATPKQIDWEFTYLEQMDIFSMYFTNSDSVQPICFYELGRHLARMQARFPETFKKRIAIGIEKGFSREVDAKIQSCLALNERFCFTENPKEHAEAIYKAYQKIKKLQAEI